MSCKLNIMRDSTGNIIIQMTGELKYQDSKQLRENLEDIYISYPEVKIRVDMSAINFVGSSGICHFVDTLKNINLFTKKKVHLSNVNEDFKKIFMLYNLTNQEVYINNFSLSNDEYDSFSDSKAA